MAPPPCITAICSPGPASKEHTVRVPPLSGQARLRQRDFGRGTKAPDSRVSRAVDGPSVGGRSSSLTDTSSEPPASRAGLAPLVSKNSGRRETARALGPSAPHSLLGLSSPGRPGSGSADSSAGLYIGLVLPPDGCFS